jgi:DNA-binding LytR/AlgR family response regulator
MAIDYSRQIGQKYVTRGSEKSVIDIEDILYVEVNDDMIIFFLRNGTHVYEIKTLTALEQQFAELGFVRIHHKSLVNGKHITGTEKNSIKIGEMCLTISKNRCKTVNEWLLQDSVSVSKK